MKKLVLSAIVVTTLLACGGKTEKAETANATASFPANASGYNLDSSANTETLKKINELAWSGDLKTARTSYVDSAMVYDNGKKLTIDENMSMVTLFKSKGITVHTDSYDAIWESVNNKIDEIGVQNYVFAYEHVTFTKGDKKVTAILFQALAFNKEGKIVKEWDVYDTSAIAELLK
jgi:hypothetical protein